MLFYEVSAKNNVNVEKAFRELALRVVKRQEELAKITPNPKVQGNKLEPAKIKKVKKNSNCSC